MAKTLSDWSIAENGVIRTDVGPLRMACYRFNHESIKSIEDVERITRELRHALVLGLAFDGPFVLISRDPETPSTWRSNDEDTIA